MEDLSFLIKIIIIQLENFQIEQRILEFCIYYFSGVIKRGFVVYVQRTLEKMDQAGISRTSASSPPWTFEALVPVLAVNQESQDGKEFRNPGRRNPAEASYLVRPTLRARCNVLQYNTSASDVILFQTDNLRIR